MKHADPILRGLEASLLAVTAGDVDEARAQLAALDLDYARELRRAKLASVAGAVRAVSVATDLRAKRSSIPAATKRAIFERDRYTCRLCGLRTIDLDVLKALSRAFPAELPFHPGWKQDVASPIYWTHSTSLEHVIPIARRLSSRLRSSCPSTGSHARSAVPYPGTRGAHRRLPARGSPDISSLAP